MALSGILLLDKEEGWTSQDCVSKLRGILHQRCIGHAGTLDPLATGLLVVLVGRATRAAQYAEAERKEYLATARWGITTDTQDITGNILSSCPNLPSPEDVRAALPSFLGEQDQIPPMYSAIKIHGQKLYDIARRGGSVERAPRRISIDELNYVNRLDNGDDVLRICCSKGTYIRTLCHDIGQAFGCGGCMSSLRRTAIGAFSVDNAKKIRDVQESDFLGIDSLFPEFEKITLNMNQEKKLRCGNSFPCALANGKYCFYSESGEFLAVGHVLNETAAVIKSFFEVD